MKYLLLCVLTCFSCVSYAANCKSGDVECIGKNLPGGDCPKGDDACRKRKVRENMQKPADTSFNFDVGAALASVGVHQSVPASEKGKSKRSVK